MSNNRDARRRRKNAGAVALARLRAKKVPPARRRDIARQAARARWGATLAGAKPVLDLSVLIGGLPDTRDAEAMLDDLRRARRPRRA